MGEFLKGCFIVGLVLLALCGWFVYSCTATVVDVAKEGAAGISRRFDGEWDEAERRADPIGYLEFLVSRLQSSLGDLEKTKRSMAESTRRMTALKEANAGRMALADDELQRLRAAYRSVGAEGGSWPVAFEGEPLDEAALKSRTASLLASRADLAAADAHYAEALAAAERTARDLPGRGRETEAKIALLEAQLETARLNRSVANSERLFAEAGDVLARNLAAAPPPVRTIEEMMKDAGRIVAPREVDAYLIGK